MYSIPLKCSEIFNEISYLTRKKIRAKKLFVVIKASHRYVCIVGNGKTF